MDKKLRQASLLVILPLVLTAFSLGFMIEADAAKAEGSDGPNLQNHMVLPMMT